MSSGRNCCASLAEDISCIYSVKTAFSHNISYRSKQDNHNTIKLNNILF